MRNEIIELEKILEQEIEACSQLENYIVEKKHCLINGDISGLMQADIQMEIYNEAIKKLDVRRKELYPESPPQNIRNMKERLKNSLSNIEKHNNITGELLKHALKVIEGSISSITKVLVPESISYNSAGKFSREENQQVISSVIHEA